MPDTRPDTLAYCASGYEQNLQKDTHCSTEAVVQTHSFKVRSGVRETKIAKAVTSLFISPRNDTNCLHYDRQYDATDEMNTLGGEYLGDA